MDRDELKQMLQENQCEVTFTKVDGSVRVMPCTLKSDLLPVIETKTEKAAKKENLDTLSVWCLDKKEWRSFRVANVQTVRTI
jgi:hypothetical protein